MQVTETLRVVAGHLSEGEDPPIAALPAGLPIFLVRLTTICVERSELSVLREFILRAVATGFVEVGDIHRFLGVRLDQVQDEIGRLRSEFFVAQDAKTQRVALMEKGLMALTEHGLTGIVVREAGCYYSGIGRSVELAPGDLVPKRRLPRDCFVVPAVPARPPRVEEIDVTGVKASLISNRGQLPRVLEVSRLGRVIRTSTLYQDAVVVIRRGAHRPPLISANGVVDSSLAQKLGGHPALQAVASVVEKHEQSVRRLLSGSLDASQRLERTDAALLRAALLALVSTTDAVEDRAPGAKDEFIKACQTLTKRSHWIGEIEAEALLAFAMACAETQITILVPEGSRPALSQAVLDELETRARAGVKVDMFLPLGDKRLPKDGHPSTHRGVSLRAIQTQTNWCGFAVDQRFAVVGSTKSVGMSTGRLDIFYGALLTDATAGKKMLEEFACQSGAIVRVKRDRRKFLTDRK